MRSSRRRELFEETHGTPVVESRFFEPWFAVKDGSDGAGRNAVERV